ncbi:GAF domain-containing protein [Vibrio hepatarius]|uniref:GAF domain-containing protein n=1 Tax=Vibrio hepatarius TaxID=171383 RepID=UPI001C09C9B0|nr:GAF domain-containing protein [Vibrio hepatarius]MBU2898864.1 GAF domain-containing protein [Vibrio hepatarius]
MKMEQYERLTKQALLLIESERDLIANLSNLSALLNMELDEVNWVGFYLIKGQELVLGPFQGLPACVRIPIGHGVCGTAVEKKQIQRVNDVHQFNGHIACDVTSNSEIVIPFKLGECIAGVLDIDSPVLGRFGENDEHGLTFLMSKVEKMLNSHAISA